MPVNTKRVFYVKYLAHTVFAEMLAQRGDVRLDRLENETPDDQAAPILAAAHVYQVGSSRDELARRFHVDMRAGLCRTTTKGEECGMAPNRYARGGATPQLHPPRTCSTIAKSCSL